MLKFRPSNEHWREAAPFIGAIPIAAVIALSANAGSWSPFATMAIAAAGGTGLVLLLALFTAPSQPNRSPSGTPLQLAEDRRQRVETNETAGLETLIESLRGDLRDVQSRLSDLESEIKAQQREPRQERLLIEMKSPQPEQEDPSGKRGFALWQYASPFAGQAYYHLSQEPGLLRSHGYPSESIHGLEERRYSPHLTPLRRLARPYSLEAAEHGRGVPMQYYRARVSPYAVFWDLADLAEAGFLGEEELQKLIFTMVVLPRE